MMLDPAMIGILVGCGVFCASIVAVFFLLYYGGSFDRMRHEAAGLPGTPGEAKPKLFDALLLAAKTLPLKPTGVELKGVLVHIRPLDLEKDAVQLYKISNGKAVGDSSNSSSSDYDAERMIWKYLPYGPFDSAEEMKAHLKALDRVNTNRTYVVTEGNINSTTEQEGVIIGTISIINNAPEHLRCELGHVWYTASRQGSGSNTEAVYLLLRHLFESNNYRRVEWRCDAHNIRSRKAAHTLGFTLEGVLRKDRIVKACNRDTAVFGALNSEWPAIREQLEGKLTKLMLRSRHAVASVSTKAATTSQATTTTTMMTMPKQAKTE